MKNSKHPSRNKEESNESNLTFTYHELLTINKLLGKVNREAHLTADDLQFFSMSPFFISASKKIHKAMMIGFRKDIEQRKIAHMLPKEMAATYYPDKDFQLSKYHGLGDAQKRFQQLSEENKQYIRSLDDAQLRAYCELYFAPFIPMEEHISELMEVLKNL